METISPVVFLNFFSWRKKYQKRDLATIGSGEKILILYRGGLGSLSEGSLRPMTSYSFNWKIYLHTSAHAYLRKLKKSVSSEKFRCIEFAISLQCDLYLFIICFNNSQ